ncbi:MAG: hypothetical protein U0Y68_23645 [Blastocatellia bacterium]
MLSSGITSIRDPKRFVPEIRVSGDCIIRGELPLRICNQVYIRESHHAPEQVLANLQKYQLAAPLGDHWFRIDRAG